MSKFPTIEYDGVSGMVSGRSAEQVYRFLADEADMDGNRMEAALYRAQADRLMEVPAAGIKDKAVDDAIAKWGRK
jgi:hypothetical protein